MKLGARIRDLRNEAGLTQVELAKRIGVAGPSLNALESGDSKSLRADTLMKLADALGINPRYIWAGKGPKGPYLDTNDEEAEIAIVYRRLNPVNRAGLLASARAMLATQPGTADNPFPSAPVPPSPVKPTNKRGRPVKVPK